MHLLRLHCALLASICSCGGAGGADALATAPDRCQERPLLWLGLRRFCCHVACTSWCSALCCIELCVLQIFTEPQLGLPHLNGPKLQESRFSALPISWRCCCLRLLGNAAAGNVNERIVPPRPPWLQNLNPFENAIAAFHAGAIIQPHAVAEVHSARPLLFSGDALSYVSFRRAHSLLN
jgi:hypothetical protein